MVGVGLSEMTVALRADSRFHQWASGMACMGQVLPPNCSHIKRAQGVEKGNRSISYYYKLPVNLCEPTTKTTSY